MAPEVIMEEDYNAKADIWSLGITLIELAEGLPPYAERSILAALQMIPRNEPPKLKEPSKWSSEFNDLISVCLQKDPKNRPSAVELLLVCFKRFKLKILLVSLSNLNYLASILTKELCS
jgi:serine/threonine protein kinase